MTETFNGSKAFLMIPPSVAHNKELLKKPKSIILLGEIVSMLNVTGEFYMSNATLAKKLDCSKKSIRNYLSLLEERKLIKRVVLKKDNGEIDSRKITAGSALAIAFSSSWSDSQDIDEGRETELLTPGTELPYPPETHCRTLGKQVATKENIYKKNNINRDIYSSANAEQLKTQKNSSINTEPSIYREIINYLNERIGAKYKPSSAINKRLIDARAKEGYSLDDFKTVIDNKCATWSNDQKMSKYLRPQTLFGTKFESYLNEKAPSIPQHTDFKKAMLTDDTVENIPDDELPF